MATRDDGLIGALRNGIQKFTRMLTVLEEPQARKHAARLVQASCDEVEEYIRPELEGECNGKD